MDEPHRPDDGPAANAPPPGRALLGGEVRGERAYRILSELGRGGYGTVYLAERADGEFRQRVAIKRLAATHLGSSDAIARFRQERQILARLEHPGIARLLDGGQLPDGSPFLVMEYVEGEKIDRYVAERGLAVAARVRLFLGVCEAVEAAHQRLIVHRDLKPGNILVGSDGAPKLLDFGIAKLLDPAAADWTVAETRLGATPLTLRYASPEQLRGEPIGTASDVYALGVVLYEILAGRSPYAGRDRTLPDLSAAICEVEPVPPSLAAGLAHGDDTLTGWGPDASRTPTRVPRRDAELAGDLDAIVLKALRKEAPLRYPSVAALAADLRRWLEGLPVEARRGSRAYRIGKYVRRHRVAVALAALVVLSLAALAVGSVLASRRLARERDAAAHERDVAARERDTARAATDFLVKLFAASDPSEARGQEITARELLARGASRIDRDLAGQPAVQAALLDTLGRVHANLGLYDEARAQLGRSLELRRGLGEEESPEAARTLYELGWSETQAGRFAEGEARLREALALERRTPEPSVLEALALSQLGAVVGYKERYEEGRALLEEAVALRRTLPPGDDRVLENALNNLALFQAALDRWEESGGTFLEVASVLERRFGPEHPTLAIVRTNASWALAGLGDWQRAESEAARAVAIAGKVLGEDHAATARARFFRGWALTGLGRFAEAEAELRQALATRRRLGVPAVEILQSMQGLARALWWSGRPDAALRLYEEAAAIGEASIAETGDRAPRELAADRADLLLALGRPGEALPLAADCRRRSAADPRELARADAAVRLAEVHSALGGTAEARALLEEARPRITGESADALRLLRRLLLARARLERLDGALEGARRDLDAAAALDVRYAPADPSRDELARVRAEIEGAAASPSR